MLTESKIKQIVSEVYSIEPLGEACWIGRYTKILFGDGTGYIVLEYDNGELFIEKYDDPIEMLFEWAKIYSRYDDWLNCFNQS